MNQWQGQPGARMKAAPAASSLSGLTDDEQHCLSLLNEAYGQFLQLPKQHSSDLEEFVLSLHRLQDLVAVRIARRKYPQFWTITNGNKDEA